MKRDFVCLLRILIDSIPKFIRNSKTLFKFSKLIFNLPESLFSFREKYDSGEIKIDENEIAEANWYKADNLPYVPPDTSLSGKLISSFVADHS